MPCSYQPTAAMPSLASNQCDEQLTVTGAFESTAPPVNMPFSSVSHVPSGVIAPLFSRRDPGLELPLAAAAAGRDLVGVDVILLRDEQCVPRRCELWRMKSL